MTLSKAIGRLRTRVEVDLESEVDLDSNEIAAEEISRAARQVSRAAYFIYNERAALTLSANDQAFDLLSGAKCSPAIFHLDGLYVNGDWMQRLPPAAFFSCYSDYLTATATARPSAFMVKDQYRVLLSQPIDSTGAAAANYARGFQLHPDYTWSANESTSLLGPDEFHELIIDRAALNCSKSYVSGSEAYQRRADIQSDYDARVREYKGLNLAEFKPATRRAGAGLVRRYFGVEHAR